MPIQIDAGEAVSSDGEHWPFAGRALGLLHYNPLAPQRLVYWIASDTLDFYRPGTPLLSLQSNPFRAPLSADFLLMHAIDSQIVAARRFNSRWNWSPGYADSPRLSVDAATGEGRAFILAEALRRQTAASFALADAGGSRATVTFSANETRQADVMALDFAQRIAVVELTGDELLALHHKLGEAASRARAHSVLLPTPAASLPPERVYSIALPAWGLWTFGPDLGIEPRRTQLTDDTIAEALARHW